MKLMKHFAGSVVAALLLSIIMAGVCAASAADFPTLDSKGSISVTIKDDKSNPVGGGALTFYKVAGVKSDNGYVYDMSVTEFNGAQDQATIEALRGDGDSSKLNGSLAKNLKSYADQKSIKGTEVTIDEKGTAKVSDLDLGLYLVVQSKAADSYQAIDPFLVSVPFKDGGSWKLDVDATPKPTAATPTTKKPVSYDPPLEKKVTGDNVPDTIFQFSFKRLSGSPMAVNAKGLTSAGGPVVSADEDELILQIKGAGTLEVGKITFTEAGTFTYACSEIDTGEKNFKYDTTEYWMEITVVEEANALKIDNILLKKGGANGTKVYEGKDGDKAVFSFTNSYSNIPSTEPPTTPPTNGTKLPQTGQLWWPVLALVLAGVILIVAGSFVKKKRS